MPTAYPDHAEWLEVDGLGGFASGTVSGERTRRYHALLLSAATPPTDRFVLVNGFDASVETANGTFDISTQRYMPGVLRPTGQRLESFTSDPWPKWVYRLEDGTRVEQELFVTHGAPRTIVRWRLVDPAEKAVLRVRPFFSGRDYHALQSANSAFRFEPQQSGDALVWRPYDGVPATISRTNGEYQHEPAWYHNFFYAEEHARGLNDLEDLASPGVFHWDLTQGEAVWILEAETAAPSRSAGPVQAEVPSLTAASLAAAERARRERFATRLRRSADAYIVRRGQTGKTIIAGYPWFTDWGRDTFIALRGLCLATGRLDDARDILSDWAGAVSQGMLPNWFPDHGETPEFNSVDASLWYVIAVHDLFEAYRAAKQELNSAVQRRLQQTIEEIVAGYTKGTRYGIRADDDGLLAAGVPGLQLTWMDVKLGDWVVTPRIGKPVEIQALWLNALWIASRFAPEWTAIFERGRENFLERFWNPEPGYLYDVVDVDHRPGTVDATFRPNQIFAIGGLPLQLIEGDHAQLIVNAVEARLATPLGLRSLTPDAPGYVPRYEGNAWQRDVAYHQGTVWPWLAGPFVEAWVRVNGNTAEAKAEARARFIDPLLRHLDVAGLGHVSELADAEPPFTPRGCPFQAWSLGELLRLEQTVLADKPRMAAVRKRKQSATS